MTHFSDTTLRDLLRLAVSTFCKAKLGYGQGTDNAFDEAAYLLLHSLQLPVDRLEPFLDARLTPKEVQAAQQLVEKRVQSRLPAAYLTGEAWLKGYHFKVNPSVLIPRSLLAALLQEQFLPYIEQPENIANILELCTGSGCLSIIAADHFPKAQIDAVDLSAAALEVAQQNVADYGLNDRIHLYEGSLYQPIKAKQRYDLILANPPYVDAQTLDALPEEYRHEPRMALDGGGEDGMQLVSEIIMRARSHLKPNGLLVIEIGEGRKALEQRWPQLNFTWLQTEAGPYQVALLIQQNCP